MCNFLTQWSDVLRSGVATAAAIAETRNLANLLQKGDERFLDKLQGQEVVVWSPLDNNGLTRSLAALMRRLHSGRHPSKLRLLAPFQKMPHMSTVEAITDNNSPAFGPKHV